MKLIFISIFTFLFSQSVIAIECSSDVNEIEAQISSAQTCYEAAKIARECAWGSTIDIQFVAAAMDVCMVKYDSWSQQHKDILSILQNDCNKKYEGSQGSMYRSMNAFCHLGVVEVLSDLNNVDDL